MDRDEFQRIAMLFERACLLEGERRQAFLDEACRSRPELRQKVDSLLRQDAGDDLTEFIERHPEVVGDLQRVQQSWRQELEERGLSEASERLLARIRERDPKTSRYEMRGELARGGMGAIFRVWDEDLRRALAMKVILHGGDGEADSGAPLARFLEEAQVTGQLDHPGVVPVHEVGLDPTGRVFFTMKLVKGKDLKAIFERVSVGEQGWSLTRALSVLLKVCEAMAYAHSKGVIHRDLKPANIMVGAFGEVYVMDWGLARVLRADDDSATEPRPEPARQTAHIATDRADERDSGEQTPIMTRDGTILGTPAYMSPEQARGEIDALDERSDVYAVGAMLYELLAGRPPYHAKAGAEAYAVVGRVAAGPPEPVSRLHPGVPAELESVCEQAMARDPAQRYADMGELADDLRAYLEDRVVRAHRTGALVELRKWVRRNAAVALTVASALLVLALFAWWSANRIRDERNTAIENERAASAERDRVLRLSDGKRLEELLGEMDALWPAHPRHEASMRAWLERARELVGRRTGHEATLEQLRRRGAGVDGEIDFGDDRESQWWHDNLQSLVTALVALEQDDPFGATIRAMENRAAFAATIRERSIDSVQVEWNEAIAAIRASPRYGGLVLREQLGLVPLGADPESGLYEFWHVQTGERPVRGGDGRLQPTEASGLVFILIPGGSFRMGAQSAAPEAANYDPMTQSGEADAAGQAVEVRLGPYLISKYEMTQGQWLRFTGDNPSYYAAGGELGGRKITLRNPVTNMSWDDANVQLDRLGLTLPTEAQWEHSCRAGSDTPWWCGAALADLDGVGNVADAHARASGGENFPRHETELDDGHTVHAPVGSFRPNPFGLHDTIGNIWEWCRDGYVSYDQPAAVGDGLRSSRSAMGRVSRGGSFDYLAAVARSALRNRNQASFRNASFGVRPARALN